MYQCDTWFMSLCADDRLVCRSMCSCIPDGHHFKICVWLMAADGKYRIMIVIFLVPSKQRKWTCVHLQVLEHVLC